MNQGDRHRSLGERLLAGVLWMGAWRWTARLLGFVSTVVIARVLVPEDLGIVATALVVIGLFETLIDLGTDRYLIRLPSAERADYDTAWTLRMIVVAVASTAIFLSAETFAGYFDEPRLASVLEILSATNVLRGFTNIGLTIYRRDLQFGPIAVIGISQRFIGMVTTIVCALVLQNYWAIVIGEVVMRIAEVVLGYLVQPYRPRFSLQRLHEQWQFSKWIVARNMATFAQARGDQFLVAKFFSVEHLGYYAMALRLAEPSRQFMAPTSVPLYSTLAKKRHEAGEFVPSLLHVIGATAVIVFPIATLVAALNEPLVLAVLGIKWASAAPLVTPLAFAIGAAAMAEPLASALTLDGRIRLLAILDTSSALAVVCVMLAASQWLTIEQFAYARMAISLVLVCIGYGYLTALLNVSCRAIVACLYRPLLASVGMVLVVATINARSHEPLFTLGIGAVAGFAVYVLVAYVLWRAAGSPYSGEAVLVQKLFSLLSRRPKP